MGKSREHGFWSYALRGTGAALAAFTLYNAARNAPRYADTSARMNGQSFSATERAFAEATPKRYPYDAIAVLSAGVTEVVSACSSPKDEPKYEMSPTAMLRIDAALYAVHLRMTNRIILVGGQGTASVSDAKAMNQILHRRAEELKVDLSDTEIIEGEKSERTNENLQELKEIAQDHKLGKILLDTNDFHLFNSVFLGTVYDVDVYGFNPEEELSKWNSEYADRIKALKNSGAYEDAQKKEGQRSVVLFLNPDLKAAEAVWTKIGPPITVFTASLHHKIPDSVTDGSGKNLTPC